MTPAVASLISALLAGVAIVMLLRERREGTRPGARAWIVMGLASLAAWTNFGAFHGAGNVVHWWEQFHHVLGAKYFAEVQYDGLYVASLQAQAETMSVPLPLVARDVRNNWLVQASTLRGHAEEVKARFAPDRWDDFTRDNAFFVGSLLAQGGAPYLAAVRRDHGFHPTPAWVALAQAFGVGLPAGRVTALFHACVDGLLLGLALLVLSRTHGARDAGLAAVLFGLGHAWSFFWNGGSFLRADWLAALLLAASAARRERWGATGALIGAAGMLRLFPAAFLLGPAVVALRRRRGGEGMAPLARLLAGFGLAIALGLAAGAVAGGRPGIWADFVEYIHRHEGAWMTNNVGLRNVVTYDATMLSGRHVEGKDRAWGDVLDLRLQHRRPLYLALVACYVGLVAACAWRARPDESIALGVVLPFALASPTCYYWAMLALTALGGRRGMPIAVLMLALGGRALDAWGAPYEATYGLLSWGLAVAFLAWLVAWLREGPVSGGAERREVREPRLDEGQLRG